MYPNPSGNKENVPDLKTVSELKVYAIVCLVGGKKCNSVVVSPGCSLPLYVAPANTEKHCKGATLGQYLSGTATFAKVEHSFIHCCGTGTVGTVIGTGTVF
jgi:hypothetical protein